MRAPSACLAATATRALTTADRTATLRVRFLRVLLPFGRPGPRFADATAAGATAALALVPLPLGLPGPRLAGAAVAAATLGLFLLPGGRPRRFGASVAAFADADDAPAFFLPRAIPDSPSNELHHKFLQEQHKDNVWISGKITRRGIENKALAGAKRLRGDGLASRTWHGAHQQCACREPMQTYPAY